MRDVGKCTCSMHVAADGQVATAAAAAHRRSHVGASSVAENSIRIRRSSVAASEGARGCCNQITRVLQPNRDECKLMHLSVGL